MPQGSRPVTPARSVRGADAPGKLLVDFKPNRRGGAPARREQHAQHAHFVDGSIESLDYDTCDSQVRLEDVQRNSVRRERFKELMQWSVTFVVGVFTAVVAVGITFGARELSALRFWLTSLAMGGSASASGYAYGALTFVCVSLALALVACSFVAFVESVAAGSGIPEIKCWLNGLKIPRAVRVKTLLAKAVGVAFAVGGGMPVGKEGPMIHRCARAGGARASALR